MIRCCDFSVFTIIIFADIEVRPLVEPAISDIMSNLDAIKEMTGEMSGVGLNTGASDLSLSLPSEVTLPVSPVTDDGKVAASSNLPAKLEVKLRTDDEALRLGTGATGKTSDVKVAPEAMADTLSNMVDPNSNTKDVLREVNALNSLLMALGGRPMTGETQGLDPSTSILSTLAGTPESHLDRLVKQMGGTASNVGANIDPTLLTNITSGLGGDLGATDAGLDLSTNTNGSSGSLDAILAAIASGDKTLLGQTIDNANHVMLAAALGMTGGKNSPFLDLFGGSTLTTLGLGDLTLSGSNTSSNVSTGVLSAIANRTDINPSQLILPASVDFTHRHLAPFEMEKTQLSDQLAGGTNSAVHPVNGTNTTDKTFSGNDTAVGSLFKGATSQECFAQGKEIWCDPVGIWDNTPGVTKWCLLNCRDKNNCDRKRCACACIEEKVFRVKYEKLPIKSP